MKKILTSVAMVLLLAGCAKEYDDSGIKARLDAVETKLNELEGNIMALQSAIGEGVFVAKVQEHIDPDSGKTDGVTITYTNGDVKWFKIETNVADVNDPVIGVISSGSGSLVWAVNGTAILIDGKEVPVYQTPVFSLDDEGYLWVEVDGKKTKLGQVKNEGATLKDGIFTDIKVVEDAEGKRVVLTLSDNSIVNIPFAEAFELIVQETDFVYEEVAPIQIPFNVTAATAKTVVGVAGYDPYDFEVTVDMDAKIIEVTPQWPGASGVFMAYADSKIGLTSIVTVSVAPIEIDIVDPDAEYDPETGVYVSYFAEADAGSLDVQVVSNVPFQVVPLVDWIKVADNTKALKKYSLPLLLADNKTKNYRDGEILLIKADANPASYEDDDILQSIVIRQLAPLGGPADLSKVESANSYLIYAPGEYKFKAVKGNSTESVGTVAKAEILWETDNTATAPAANAIIASVSVDGDYIVFSTPEPLKPGNALIAAKDADGKILWSWHIWAPATEIVNSTFGGIVNVPMMDRNLGALVPAAADAEPDGTSIGMLYQWGRKDPFPGAAIASAAKPFVTNGTISLVSEKQNYTVAETIQNPTVYVVTGGDSNKTWMTAEEMSNDFWGIKKTVYDPCPPGYIVPTRDKDNCPLWAATANFAVDQTNKVLKVSASAEAKEFVLFPVNGYLDQGEIKNAGSRSYYWSSYASGGEKNIAYMMYINGTKVTVEQQRMSRGGNIRCVVANENAIVPPTPVENIVDLSEEGTANCYIVSEAGKFKFKTVKSKVTSEGYSEESVGTVDKAELLWETWNNGEEVTANSVIASVSYAEDYITFSTPATLKPGNALIAAKDAEGKILWSWHIWIPKTAIESSETGFGLAQAGMMDRNLGALVATSASDEADITSAGLMYQWGRKDPFMGPKAWGTNEAATLNGVATTIGTEQVTVEESIANPTTFVGVKSDWSKTVNNEYWADADAKTKSEFDPCPAGYRVPRRDTGLRFWSGSTLTTETTWALDLDHSWFKVGNPAVVFPICGYISYNGGYDKNGTEVYVWSAHKGNDNIAYCLRLKNSDSVSTKNEQPEKATGAVVRCVAIAK